MNNLKEARLVFASNLCKKMDENNIKATDIRDLLDVSAPSVINNWRNGKALPSLKNLYLLCHYLDTSVHEMLNEPPLENDPLPVAANFDELHNVIKNRMYLLATLNQKVSGFARICTNMLQIQYRESLPGFGVFIEIACRFDLQINVLLPGRCDF
jgi:transcriptional regulator with XRE-family HTH domain